MATVVTFAFVIISLCLSSLDAWGEGGGRILASIIVPNPLPSAVGT